MSTVPIRSEGSSSGLSSTNEIIRMTQHIRDEWGTGRLANDTRTKVISELSTIANSLVSTDLSYTRLQGDTAPPGTQSADTATADQRTNFAVAVIRRAAKTGTWGSGDQERAAQAIRELVANLGSNSSSSSASQSQTSTPPSTPTSSVSGIQQTVSIGDRPYTSEEIARGLHRANSTALSTTSVPTRPSSAGSNSTRGRSLSTGNASLRGRFRPRPSSAPPGQSRMRPERRKSGFDNKTSLFYQPIPTPAPKRRKSVSFVETTKHEPYPELSECHGADPGAASNA